MEAREDVVTVECPCGEMHQFAAQYAGRVARCPKLNRSFRVPSSSGPVAFIVDPQPESVTPDDEKDQQASSGRTGGWLVKRATNLYQAHKQKRGLYRQTHCRCPHCKAENLTVDFMCTKCGCPLHDQKAAFLFMEKRRQEAHELKLAQATDAAQQANPPPVARPLVPQTMPPRIEQKVVVRQGSGCLTIIGATALIILALLMIPICSGVLSSNSYPGRDRGSSRTVETDTTALPPLGPLTTGTGAATSGVYPSGPNGATPSSVRKPKLQKLEVEVLKVHMVSRSHASVDLRFMNTSGLYLQHWAVLVEVYGVGDTYLAHGEAIVSHLRPGQSKVAEATLLDTEASDIRSYRITLSGAVGESGLRIDDQFELKIR